MLIDIFNYIFNFVILQIYNHYYYFNNLNLILNLMFNYRIFYQNQIFYFLRLIRFFLLVGNILMVIGHVYRYVLLYWSLLFISYYCFIRFIIIISLDIVSHCFYA